MRIVKRLACRFTMSCLIALLATTRTAVAQERPPVRPLGLPDRVTTEPFAAASQVRVLSDGRLLLNDNVGRRLVLLDSNLVLRSVVADTSPATDRAYTTTSGLIAYVGDSSLLVDPAALVMHVIDPAGRIVRTIAVPQPREANFLIGGPFGTPGIDAQGRLVYMARLGGFTRVIPTLESGERPPPPIPDSAIVIRFELSARTIDTVARFQIPSVILRNTKDKNQWVTMRRIVDPLPFTDDWALLSDSTVAIIRGREYRVEFHAADGATTSTAKLPFDWQRLLDGDKAVLIDSTRKVIDAADSLAGRPTAAQRAADSSTAVRRLGSASQSGESRPAGTGGRMANATVITDVIALEEMPDYRPPFRLAAARGDLDGNLWIRTSTVTDGRVVYDVIARSGAIRARVSVPRGRVIVGFGPGAVVYTAVLDGQIARLERAHWR